MQNVQNAAEIQQRVINLVNLYRRKVGYESQIAISAKNDRDFWEQESVNMVIEEGLPAGGIYGTGPHTEVWTKHLMVNEQLLGHFYSEVAGEKAEQEILDQLLPDVYDKTVFTEEEELFLKSHFKELVNYIILTPCDDCLEFVNHYDQKDALTIPNEVLELISSRVELAAGSKVYNPNAGFAQFANLFKEYKFICGGKNAWMQVALYTNGTDAEIIENDMTPQSYDAVVSYVIGVREEGYLVDRLCEAYKKLPAGGKFVLLCPSELLAEKDNTSSLWFHNGIIKTQETNMAFRKMLVEDRAIKEIIQLPQVMSNSASHDTYCLLIAEKGRGEGDVTLIDARIANNDLDTKHYMQSFNNDKFNTILQNDGIDPNTGLRKVLKVSSEELSPEILIPQVYVVERPSGAEHPVPLSSLCSLASAKVRDVQFDLPEDTPWIHMSDLAPLYTGELDLSSIRKADCSNNPHFVEGSDNVYGFDEDGRFADSIWAQIGKPEGHHVLNYRKCTYLDGNSDAVLYDRSVESGVQVAVVRATGKPYAVSSSILVFCSKDELETNSLAALLRLPIVFRQLIAYQDYGLGHHLNEILVPMDKRIIGDELYRMKIEESVINELGEEAKTMKTEYINEVRMRKHDMGQKVFDLINTEDLMRYYLENRDSEANAWNDIEEQLNHFRDTIWELSTMLDHLSEEDHFGVPELVDLKDYLKNIQHSENVSGFKVSFNIDKESLLKQKQLYEVFRNTINMEARSIGKERTSISSEIGHEYEMFRRNVINFNKEQELIIQESILSKVLQAPANVMIAKNDLLRLISNIITNAKTHGFTDTSRKDYKIEIFLGYDEQRKMFKIDFRNNGIPLPKGMNKLRFGIKGEKAGKSAGTGIGGSVVKSIVDHYKGDYDIFMDNNWTVVRILLPIAI